MPPAAPLISALLAAYALGCVNSGYYLVRAVTGQDIRTLGSGGTGATNVGRVLGTGGFLLTLILDAAKGVLAILLAQALGISPEALWSVALAVLAGHIWPVQLRFRGGRGVATWIGAVAVLDLLLVACAVVAGALLWRPVGRFTWAGLLALCAVPAFAAMLDRSAVAVLGSGALAVVLVLAHRHHVSAAWRALRGVS